MTPILPGTAGVAAPEESEDTTVGRVLPREPELRVRHSHEVGTHSHDDDERARVIAMPTSRQHADVSVIIPAFNEDGTIANVVESVFTSLGDNSEVIVVDDGSTDDTAARAEKAGARVVRIPLNAGNGAAIKAGIRASTREFVVFMDADGQHSGEDLMRLLEHAGPFDMVVAARDPSTQASIGRRVANAVYNRLASYMTGRKVLDLTSGFRVVRRSVAMEFLPLLPNGFSYPTTITLSSMRAGYSVRYVPFRAGKRKGSSHIRVVRDGASFLLIMFKVITLFSPLKVFLPLSLIPAAGAGTAIALSIAGLAGLWTIATMLITASLTLMGLGLVSEQICAMRFERLNLVAEQAALRAKEMSW